MAEALLTAEEMRALEREAMDSGRVTGLELMERAGRGVVEAMFGEWSELAASPHRAVVLCGPGNNGGDGYVIARHLAALGWTVRVYSYGDPERLSGDAATNHRRWVDAGGATEPLENIDLSMGWRADVVVDALFGTGLDRPIETLTPLLECLVTTVETAHPRVVAVDLPSGLHTDTGEVLVPDHGGEGAAAAHLTVTFHQRKRAHKIGSGAWRCGKVVVRDIGL